MHNRPSAELTGTAAGGGGPESAFRPHPKVSSSPPGAAAIRVRRQYPRANRISPVRLFADAPTQRRQPRGSAMGSRRIAQISMRARLFGREFGWRGRPPGQVA